MGRYTVEDIAENNWYTLTMTDGMAVMKMTLWVTSVNSAYVIGENGVFDYTQIKRRSIVDVDPLIDPNDQDNYRSGAPYRDLDGSPFAGFSGDLHNEPPF